MDQYRSYKYFFYDYLIVYIVYMLGLFSDYFLTAYDLGIIIGSIVVRFTDETKIALEKPDFLYVYRHVIKII